MGESGKLENIVFAIQRLDFIKTGFLLSGFLLLNMGMFNVFQNGDYPEKIIPGVSIALVGPLLASICCIYNRSFSAYLQYKGRIGHTNGVLNLSLLLFASCAYPMMLFFIVLFHLK